MKRYIDIGTMSSRAFLTIISILSFIQLSFAETAAVGNTLFPYTIPATATYRIQGPANASCFANALANDANGPWGADPIMLCAAYGNCSNPSFTSFPHVRSDGNTFCAKTDASGNTLDLSAYWIWYACPTDYSGTTGNPICTKVTSTTETPPSESLIDEEVNTCSGGLDSEGSPSPFVGNPIDTSTGDKLQIEADYLGLNDLEFKRFYHSISFAPKGITGSMWRNSYDLKVSTLGNARYVSRPGGKQFIYSNNNNLLTPDGSINEKLTEIKNGSGTTTGYKLVTQNQDRVENYNSIGKITSIVSRSGTSTSFAYDASARMSLVTDTFGRSLSFGYDYSTTNRLVRVTDPAGKDINYEYDISGKLTKVTYQDNKFRRYLYEDTTYPTALTGIIDENGDRYATWSYDTSGKAITSQHAGGVDNVTVTYGTNSSTITDSRGALRTLNFQKILGVSKVINKDQPAGSGCSASVNSATFDANGNLATKTNFNGYMTTYAYDLTRNLQTSRTEGLTSSGALISGVTRTTVNTWHATWRLPLTVEVYAGDIAIGTPLRRTSYSYDTNGNLTQLTVSDPNLNLSRTTTTTYTYSSTVPGVVLSKVVDGPRSDVNDTTTYTYYAPDATCTASTSSSNVTNLGCRGQLQSITNALGQTTQFTRYNHHGQVEESIDPNGLVTTNTYDLRQRLLTRTVGTEITTLQYDGVGQVTQITMPDSSTLVYTYDAAHRLTKVTDSLGNHVDYTLDTEGNRTAENTYDPSGNLAKTLTKSYDALNRLQSVTGIQE